MTILEPDLVYQAGAFRSGLAVCVDEETGRIADVVPAREPRTSRGDVVRKLAGRALLPGFVNAHSHAFQRLIRGCTQWRPAEPARADFWSWRDAMYGAALSLSPEQVEAVSRQCFLEMLKVGITAVGEFHYLHRDQHGRPYADTGELALRVIAAARSLGLRIVLLDVCYAAGGIDEPLRREQRRFATPELDAFLAGVESLARTTAEDPLVSVGVAPHSVRAVPRAWLPTLATWAAAQERPCHMHLSEQPAEVEACMAAWRLRPVQVAYEAGLVSSRFTAVHATHVDAAEIALLADAGAAVCACPTTERDLGDGFLPAAALVEQGVPIALGTDSQTRIDIFDEMRAVEYHERLRTLSRVVLGEEIAGRSEVAPRLLRYASRAGADALCLDGGRIEAGALADLVAIDLEHASIAGWTAETLGALLALCAGPEVVRDVWVAGVRVVEDRHHAAEVETLRAFRDVAGAFQA